LYYCIWETAVALLLENTDVQFNCEMGVLSFRGFRDSTNIETCLNTKQYDLHSL